MKGKGPNLRDRKSATAALGVTAPSYRGFAGLPRALDAIVNFKYRKAPNEEIKDLKETARINYADALSRARKAGLSGWRITLGQRAELIRFLTRPVDAAVKENNIFRIAQGEKVTSYVGGRRTAGVYRENISQIEKFMEDGTMKIKVSARKSM